MVDQSSVLQDKSSEVQITVADKRAFEDYIKNIVLALDSADNISALEDAFSEQTAQESIKRFLNDGQCHSLLVQKSSSKGILLVLLH